MSRSPLFCWLLLLACLAGCAGNEYVVPRWTAFERFTERAWLVAFPQPASDRTNLTLERYNLAVRDGDSVEQKHDTAETLQRLIQSQREEPNLDKLYGIAELAYLDGRQQLARGYTREALDRHFLAIVHAYWYLFDPAFDAERNPYDPRFHQSCAVYNKALEAALRLLQDKDQLVPGLQHQIQLGQQQLQINVVARGGWQRQFDELKFVTDFDVQSLAHRHQTHGLGVPMVGICQQPETGAEAVSQYYPSSWALPVTAFLRVPASSVSASTVTSCLLELHDPLAQAATEVESRSVALTTDISVPLAFQLDQPTFRERTDVATLSMVRPQEALSRSGLFMLEPYDPGKIPVVLVHGLLSTPLTWMDMYNDLRSFREIRDRYQFWFYLYPTGQPFWITAAQLRQSLADLQGNLDPAGSNEQLQKKVLIGHSMGGLISLMQTMESGDDFWQVLSDKPYQDLQGPELARQQLAATVFFSPNRSVQRVITLATPFHGSRFANDYTRWLGQRLIELPSGLRSTAEQLIEDNPGFFRDTRLLTTSTSIDALAPGAPIFTALDRAGLAPWVHYHNIKGVSPASSLVGKFSEAGDGVVGLDSSHCSFAESEITVQSEHVSIHRTSTTILEVRRILLLPDQQRMDSVR
jgi:hypothetical protein